VEWCAYFATALADGRRLAFGSSIASIREELMCDNSSKNKKFARCVIDKQRYCIAQLTSFIEPPQAVSPLANVVLLPFSLTERMLPSCQNEIEHTP